MWNLLKSIKHCKAGDVCTVKRQGLDWDVLDALEMRGEVKDVTFSDIDVRFTITDKFDPNYRSQLKS